MRLRNQLLNFTSWMRPLATAFAVLAAGPALAVQIDGQNVGIPAGPSAAPDNALPAIAEQAETMVKQMAAYIGSAREFTFHADITFDHVLPSQQKVQFAAAENVALQRSGRLYVEWSSDLGDRQFWYDGKTVTLYDPSSPFYASAPAPSQLDAMLDKILSELDFTPPLSDLLYSDPYQRVKGAIRFGFDLGENDVGGRSCRTFAFVSKDIDWQIWINPGPQLVPCKLVITYRNQPSKPQFAAVFSNWNFAPRIATPVFTPDMPPGAEKIPFRTVTAAKQ
jgi:hypothetical protein